MQPRKLCRKLLWPLTRLPGRGALGSSVTYTAAAIALDPDAMPPRQRAVAAPKRMMNVDPRHWMDPACGHATHSHQGDAHNATHHAPRARTGKANGTGMPAGGAFCAHAAHPACSTPIQAIPKRFCSSHERPRDRRGLIQHSERCHRQAARRGWAALSFLVQLNPLGPQFVARGPVREQSTDLAPASHGMTTMPPRPATSAQPALSQPAPLHRRPMQVRMPRTAPTTRPCSATWRWSWCG